MAAFTIILPDVLKRDTQNGHGTARHGTARNVRKTQL
jgi:hypothetical protein